MLDDSPSSLTAYIIFFVICLFCRAVFSFLETSIAALRLFKLKEMAAASSEHYHTLFQSLERHPHRVLITILIASNLADVILSAISTNITQIIFSRLHLSHGLGFWAGIVLATVTILLFGEIIPKNLARGRGEGLFRSSLWITNIIFYLFYPIVSFLIGFTDFITAKISGSSETETGSEWVSSEHEIQFLIDYIFEKGLIEREKTDMLQNIFELGRTRVKDIMIAASDIVSIPVTLTAKEALDLFIEHQFSRLPAWLDNKDNMVGMVHLKDVVAAIATDPSKQLKELLRPILLVPESVKVNQLLREFRYQHVHIALVINEYGEIAGLITLEDVLEEIVGEISDEHEEPIHEKISPVRQGSWLVDATISLTEMTDLLKISFDDTQEETLGGFITERLHHLPKKGESLLYKDYWFQVQRATEKRIMQILVTRDTKTINTFND